MATNEMTREQAIQNVEWLKKSFLVIDGMSIKTAAETYDEMNETTEFQDSLKMLLKTA